MAVEALSPRRLEVSTLWKPRRGGANVSQDTQQWSGGLSLSAVRSDLHLLHRTLFEHRQLTPMQVVPLVHGGCKDEPTATLARELGVTRGTVHDIRKALHANAQALQPATPLLDQETETDEMFENAGKKAKYTQYYTLPIINHTMDTTGPTVASRMQYNGAGVTASIIPGVSITITAQKAATVPVTGLKSAGSEVYGSQNISYVNLAAGQSVTLPLT